MFVKRRSLIPLEVSGSRESPRILRSDISTVADQKPLKQHRSMQNPSITDNINSFNYNSVINVNTGIPDEDNRIREWLSPLEPQQRHQDVRADRLDGVGDWFLETKEFLEWSSGEDGSPEKVLFCSGGPGVGIINLIHYLCKWRHRQSRHMATNGSTIFSRRHKD